MARSANSPWGKERQIIECCHNCVPPKRYPGCGDHCPEYKKEKAQHKAAKEREKENMRKRPIITNYDFNKF